MRTGLYAASAQICTFTCGVCTGCNHWLARFYDFKISIRLPDISVYVISESYVGGFGKQHIRYQQDLGLHIFFSADSGRTSEVNHCRWSFHYRQAFTVLYVILQRSP